MFPVRCYTCNSVLAQHWKKYSEHLLSNGHPSTFLDAKVGKRMCCRRMFLSHVDMTHEQTSFPARDVILDDSGTVLRREAMRERTISCD